MAQAQGSSGDPPKGGGSDMNADDDHQTAGQSSKGKGKAKSGSDKDAKQKSNVTAEELRADGKPKDNVDKAKLKDIDVEDGRAEVESPNMGEENLGDASKSALPDVPAAWKADVFYDRKAVKLDEYVKACAKNMGYEEVGTSSLANQQIVYARKSITTCESNREIERQRAVSIHGVLQPYSPNGRLTIDKLPASFGTKVPLGLGVE